MKRTITELENLFMISANQAKEITKANSGINQTNIINLLLKSIKETLEHTHVGDFFYVLIRTLEEAGYTVIQSSCGLRIKIAW